MMYLPVSFDACRVLAVYFYSFAISSVDFLRIVHYRSDPMRNLEYFSVDRPFSTMKCLNLDSNTYFLFVLLNRLAFDADMK